MFLVLSTANQHRGAFYELVKFRELAYGSRVDLLKNLAPESLHRKEAVLSLGTTSLLVKDVLRDITLGFPNITATYSEYLEKLVGVQSFISHKLLASRVCWNAKLLKPHGAGFLCNLSRTEV